jgi:hypothetical protein
MPGRDAEPGYRVQSSTNCSSLSLEIGLHLQELEAQHLCVEGDRMGPIQASIERLVDDPARGCRLFAACSRMSRSCLVIRTP